MHHIPGAMQYRQAICKTIRVVVSKSTNQNVCLTFLVASMHCLMGVCWSYQTLFAIITKLITTL